MMPSSQRSDLEARQHCAIGRTSEIQPIGRLCNHDGNVPTNNLLAEPIPKPQTIHQFRDTAAAMADQADLMYINRLESPWCKMV